MAKKRSTKSASENLESRALVRAAFDLARSLGISKLLVQADELREFRLVDRLRESEQVIWLTRSPAELPLADESNDAVLHLPETRLTQMSQLKIALLLAVMNKEVALDDSVICLSGVAGSERLDTLLVANARRNFPWFRKRNIEDIRSLFATREVAQLIDIALRLAAEGREGKPVGTIFVLGDEEQLEPYLRQLVLNPCEGHPRRERSIHNPEFFETIREFAGLDGCFVVNGKGIVQSAGTYLDAPIRRAKLRPGLGARHAAALSVTAAAHAIAVAISASSGNVTVFHEGRAILELERPALPSTA
jgi:DNA integrity scanning protein DisA with diadenylate cyclase activity